MLVHYQCNLIAKELFPEDTSSFRLRTVSRDTWETFVNHPDDIALVSSTGDVTIRSPPRTLLVENFKVT